MPYNATESAKDTSSDGYSTKVIKDADGKERVANIIKAPKDSALTRINRKDGTSTDNPLVPWYRVTGIPPSYYDDILPTHRDSQGMYFLRIGDCHFYIPPLFIRVTNSTATQRIPTIRQKESINISSGYNKRDIELSLWFNDVEQINGIQAEAPQGKTYYMDGLRSLVAQFKRTPFMPVVNELLNSVYGIYACTLVNISVSTVPGFPDCLQVTLNMKEFNAHPFIGAPTPVLEKMYCWPLFRWYYQQMLLDDETTLARTRLPKIVTDNFSGEISFKLLPESILAAPKKATGVEADFSSSGKSKLQFLNDEYLWMEEVQMSYSDFTVDSMQIGLGNIVTDLQLAYYQSPTHQYIGSLDTMITLNITTQSRQVLAEFVSLHDTVQMYNRKYKDKIACGYIGVTNELINMFAVDTVTIQGLDITTSEGNPDLFNIRLNLLSYNKTQKDNESSKPLAPHQVLGEAINGIGQINKDKVSYKNPMILDGVLEDLVNELEVYPDLELPNYTEVRKAVDEINTWRTSKGLKTDLGAKGSDFLCPYTKEADVVVKEEETKTKSWRDRDVTKWPGAGYVESHGPGDKWFDLFVQRLKERQWIDSSYSPSGWDSTLSNATATISRYYSETDGYGGRVGNNAWDCVVNINWRATKPYPGMVLKKGSSNSYVGEVQEALAKIPDPSGNPYYNGSVDNSFGQGLLDAVWRFQGDSGFLNQDGAIGVNTWSEIFVAAGVDTEVIPAVTEHHTTENAYFVEPDFYIFYPNPYRFGILDTQTVDDTLTMLRDGNSNGMLDKSLKNSGTGKNAIDKIMEMQIKAQDLGADYGVPAKNALDNIIDIPHVQDSELYKLMAHDMHAYGRRYTMTRAFPTMMFLFVDEGLRVRGTRLWSNMYAYHSVISCSVTKDKDMPAETCELTLSNIYSNLSTNPSYATAEKKGFFEAMFLEVDKEMIEARKRLYEYMAIRPGCRIHLRMGYGSSPQSLPIVFNGVVAEINVGEVLTIIGQGDGVELTNPMPDTDPYETNGVFNIGTEASNIIRNIMTARDGFEMSFTWKKNSGVIDWLMPSDKKASATGPKGVGSDFNVVETNFTWNKQLVMNNKPEVIILHHAAGNGTVESIHKLHQGNGWAGIGYHYYIRKDGKIYRGRPEKAEGTHCADDTNRSQGWNRRSIGICAEGNFMNETMSEEQKVSIAMVVKDIMSRYSISKDNVFRHKDKGSTDCPGTNYPFDEIKSLASGSTTSSSSSGSSGGSSSASTSQYMGFANGSKYGIEHFGYVFVNDQENASLMAFFQIGDEGKWAYDTCKNVYKGTPYYADEGDYRKTTDISNEKWFPFDEENIYMYLCGKAPWDVFKHLAAASSDYIAATHSHNFRSTLFFGQPHWLMKYGYHYVGGNVLKERKDIRLYYEKVKAFQQVHIIDSIHDIIDNQMQANTQGVVTAVIPTYVLGKTVKTDMCIFADKNIYPECQRTAYYDTTAVQNFWGPDAVYKALGLDFSKKNARTMGLSYLQNSFRDMYKGEIIILGDASLKPYDVTYVTDTFSKISGPCGVGRVTHMIGIETGFVTTYKPDLISISKEAGSVGTARTLSAIQLFCFNLFTSKMVLHSASTLDRAIEVFNMDKKNGIAEVIEDARYGIDATVALGVLALGPVSWIGVLLAMVAWVAVDELIEWGLNVFTGRNDHGITVIPMYYKDKPFLGYLKGYKELIPFQEDESLNGEASYIKDLDMDKSMIEETIKERQAEFSAMNDSVFKRRSTGVDIFKIQSESAVKLADIDYRQAYSYGAGSAGSAGTGSGGGSAIRDKIVAEARKLVDDPNVGYEWAGEGPTKYDCSGFTKHCYDVGAGIALSHNTDAQLAECKNGGMILSISEIDKALPGDLIFYGTMSSTSHVAIYAGNGKVYSASTASRPLPEQVLEQEWNASGKACAIGRHPSLVAADKSASSSSSGGSQAVSGNIDGWGYVHKFSQAVLTHYNDNGYFADGTRTTGYMDKVAAAHGMPIGTKLYIPSLKGTVNSDGIFTVLDTGGPFFDFDIYTNAEIGKMQGDVYVVKWGDGRVLQSFEKAIQQQKDLGQWDSYQSAYNQWKDKFATLNYKHS